MFPVEVQIVEALPVELITPSTPSKVYKSEDEIYAELGITKS
jgi:hypothetical protein